MRIVVAKGPGRHRLACVRQDGSSTQAATGPGLLAHDHAHYVAERALELRRGFFGQVAAGCTLAELSDPARIPPRSDEIWTAETLARAVGATATGACAPDELPALVRAELGDAALPSLTVEVARAMSERYRALLDQWRALPDGATLTLDWS